MYLHGGCFVCKWLFDMSIMWELCWMYIGASKVMEGKLVLDINHEVSPECG